MVVHQHALGDYQALLRTGGLCPENRAGKQCVVRTNCPSLRAPQSDHHIESDFEHWDKLFEDTIMTVAAINRLVHYDAILQCMGESYRRKASINRQTEHGS